MCVHIYIYIYIYTHIHTCLQVVNSWFKAPALLQQPDPELERHRKISYYIKCIDVMLYYNTSQSACK